MYHNKKINDVLMELNSSKNGLAVSEAERRKDEKNLNKLSEEKKEGILKKYLKQFSDIMIIVLVISAIASIMISVLQKRYSDLFEGGIILFIVLLNTTMGVLQEKKAENALENLKKRIVPQCDVIRDGKTSKIVQADLVVGDVVVLDAGAIVPADIRLIETYNLKIDESSITGESVESDKDAEVVVEKNTVLAERINMAYSGTVVMNGRGLGVVVAIGKNTEMGQIATILTTSKKDLTPLQRSLNVIGKIISYSVLLIAFVIFIMEYFVSKQNGLMESFLTAVALAVAAIPESMPAVITVIMAVSVQKLANKNAIIKRLHAVETLGSCQIICSDKTGTLTQNKMTIKQCYYNNQVFYDVNHNYVDIHFKEMINAMILCNNAKIEFGNVIGEPTEKALFEFAIKCTQNLEKIELNNKKLIEIPFTSDRKLMTNVYQNSNNEFFSYTKGAFDKIIDICEYALINGQKIRLNDELKTKLIVENEKMCKNALRVLAFAYKEHFDFDKKNNYENGLTFIAMAGMIDPPRKETYDAIKKCFSASLKPIMITGDHKITAFAVAKDLGIANKEEQVLTGNELNLLSDEQLAKRINNITVFARVNPDHKVRIVETFKKIGKIVAMTGDGVNDAPALKRANIGIGMGIMGTEITKDVADMIISDDNFATVVTAVEEGRKIYSNIQKTIQFLLSTNAVEVITLFLTCLFFPNYVFLIPSQILFVNFITDSLPAIGLGMEKAEFDIMKRPPRDSRLNVISGRIGFNIFYQATLQVTIVMAVFTIGLKFYSNVIASTMVFYLINYMQIIHSINLKSDHSLKTVKLMQNKTFNITFIIGMLMITMVAVIPFLSKLFGLVSLNTVQWVIVLIFSVLIVPLVELVKLIIGKITYERVK